MMGVGGRLPGMKQAETYNYQAFDFRMDGPGVQRWDEDAPDLGDTAPDFELPDVAGTRVRLRDLRGRPVVVEFGSYTCPIFCGHADAMEQLAARHPEAAFVVIYTREAHPGERTPAHRTQADKDAAARRLVADEGLRRTVLVDTLDAPVHRSYGTAWDAVFVLDADGIVVLRRAWNRPDDVEAMLASLSSGDSVVPRASLEMSPPTTRPFGEGLLRGGEQAVRDFYLSAPRSVQERFETSPSRQVRQVVTSLATPEPV